MSDPDYTTAWRDLRKRRLILWGLFFGYIPDVFLLYLVVGMPLLALIGEKEGGTIFIVIALLWMVSFMIAGIRYSYFRCPRCHATFFWTWWHRNPFSGRCLHCGLRRGAISK